MGGGYIWIGCNGAGTAASLREFKRPFDRNYGEIVKLDMKGKQVKGYRTPWGSIHGTDWNQQTDKLWAVAPGPGLAVEMDPKDDLRILRMVPIRRNGRTASTSTTARSGFSPAPIGWCRARSGNGRVLEIWAFGPDDPDPHGMCSAQLRLLHRCRPWRRAQAERRDEAADDFPVPDRQGLGAASSSRSAKALALAYPLPAIV